MQLFIEIEVGEKGGENGECRLVRMEEEREGKRQGGRGREGGREGG